MIKMVSFYRHIYINSRLHKDDHALIEGAPLVAPSPGNSNEWESLRGSENNHNE